MQRVELKVSPRDWIFIIIIGAFFGFFISLFFYFLNKDLQNISTIIFSTSTAIFISLFASFLISVSNNFILPKVNQKFWYAISFIFSFCSGALGFSFSFLVFSLCYGFFCFSMHDDLYFTDKTLFTSRSCRNFFIFIIFSHFLASNKKSFYSLSSFQGFL